jgi:hypothetical protein
LAVIEQAAYGRFMEQPHFWFNLRRP